MLPLFVVDRYVEPLLDSSYLEVNLKKLNAYTASFIVFGEASYHGWADIRPHKRLRHTTIYERVYSNERMVIANGDWRLFKWCDKKFGCWHLEEYRKNGYECWGLQHACEFNQSGNKY